MTVSGPRVLATAPVARRGGIDRALTLAAAVGVAFGLGLGLLVGGSDSPEEQSGPTVDEAIPNAFSHDAAGAARAAARYTELFGVELALDVARARAVLDRVATPAFAEQQLTAMAELRGPITDVAARRSDLTALSRTAATEVERFDGEAATVRVVSLAALGGPGARPELSVTEQRMDLVWEAGRWRATGVDGPSREVAGAESKASAGGLRRALEGTDVGP